MAVTKQDLVYDEASKSFIRKEVPWLCSGCSIPFEKYEEMNYNKNEDCDCGCLAEFCDACYEKRYPKGAP